jgi:iron complex outermembrane receptor protein
MKNSQAVVFGKTRRAAWLAICSLPFLAGSIAFAQQTTDSSTTSDQTVKLDKYVVTGSYIPAAADEANALPVQIVDSKMIDATGATKSLLDVLRKAVPQIIGGNNIGVENGNIAGNATNGGSSVALRNTQTLVLIDGQRVAFDPVGASGGVQFVDLNIIPVSAVERIEVLTDGASAIYGSDAVSGVINVILKKDFQGAEIGGYLGFTQSDKTHATYRDRQAHVVVGASTGKTQVTFAAEFSKSDPLFEKNYNYTSPVFLTPSYPGVINDPAGQFYKLNPNLNAPPATPPTTLANLVAAGVYVPTSSNDIPLGFDLSHIPTFLGALEKKIGSVAFSHEISDTLTIKGSFLYSKTSNQYQLNPQPISLKVNTPTTTGLPGIPFTDPNITVRNRFVAYPPRLYLNDTDSLRGTVEVDGKIGSDWTWTADALYNDSRQVATAKNQILNSALVAGIFAGQINLAAITQDPTLFAQANIFGDSIANYDSGIVAYDVRASGRLFDLPTGPVSMAAGVGYRKETSSASADANSIINPVTGTSAWNNGVSISPFQAQRNIKSVFVEAKVPLASPENHIPGLYTLGFDGAVRHEDYSDTDNPTVPKLSLRYLPFNDEFALRSTYSRSFAAPTLFSLFGPAGSGSTPSLTGLTAYNTAGQPIGNFPPIQGFQQSGANPNLKPSKSKNYTVGFIYSPKKLKGFSVSVDYYNIKETDIVGTPAPTTTMIQSVEQFGPASPYTQYIHLNNFGQLGGVQVTTPGQLSPNPSNVYVDQFGANVAGQNQNGLDLTLKYDFATASGTYAINSTWVKLMTFRVQNAATQPWIELVGTNGPAASGVGGTLPSFREYTSVSWESKSGAYAASLSNIYIPSVVAFADLTTKVGSYTQFDAQGSVEVGRLWAPLKGLKFTVGINNIFNKYPPVDPQDFSDPPADTGVYGSFGRFYYTEFSYKF